MIGTMTGSVVRNIIAERGENYVRIYSDGELLYRIENEIFLSLKDKGIISIEY